ncbi:MAG: Fe-S-binding domain-containing protein, partial [Solirubrobacterales bacterium]
MNWYTLSPNLPWLTLVLVLPLAGALLVALVPSVARRTVKQLGILTAVATLILVLAIIGGFQHGVGNLRFQFEEVRPWIPGVGISYHLGVDGLSLFLVVLMAFLTCLSLLASWRSVQQNLKAFLFFVLLLETSVIGVFVALDLVLYYIFWEAMLVPM